MCVALNSLRLFEELHLTGGVLRIDGEVVAFTIGEPICEDTYVVHIEKAYADVQGAYTMINQQFVEHECMNYKYVNRKMIPERKDSEKQNFHTVLSLWWKRAM